MKTARIYLLSGAERDVRVLNDEIGVWIEDVKTRGIYTSDEHIPYHSIDHIWFYEPSTEEEIEDAEGEEEAELKND
jgi:alpha-N-acetylglucosamine transferase